MALDNTMVTTCAVAHTSHVFSYLLLSPVSLSLPPSEYGAVFRLSTEIAGNTALSPLLSGENILSCFSFDGDRFAVDVVLLAVIGVGGLLLSYGLLRRA